MTGRGLLPAVGLGLLAPRESARRHLRAGLSLDAFFDELNRRGVRYAVLRWFETLPCVDPGEDVDLLVADEDLPVLRDLLGSHRVAPARQKFDVYSATGLPGSDYRGIPYLSPALAHRLLERAVLLRGRYRVPAPEDHFDSMAYHAVYHKGERSGLPPAAGVPTPADLTAEHDYDEALAELAAQLSLTVPLTLTGLDAHLADRGLRPPMDTLEKLAETNTWLRHRLDDEFGPADADLPGLAVFVVRERAAHDADRIADELLREGWQPLETVPLDPAAAERVRARVRGGNWGAGPWPVAGGGPAVYVVAYDMQAAVTGCRPDDEPGRVLASKLAIRRRLLADRPMAARFNPLHSSDNPRQALDYLRAVDDPTLLPRLHQRITELREAMVFPYPVVELLPSHRRRAVTAVVAHPEYGECVCKLFYPSARRFLLRELRARTEFEGLPGVPALLEAHDNWLLTPRYQDTGEHVWGALPGTPHVQLRSRGRAVLVQLTRALHDRGAYLLDLTSLNLVSDPLEGLKVLDWEFLQDLPEPRPALRFSPTFRGRAENLGDVDTPLGVSAGSSVFTAFSPVVTGVPIRVLLSWPAPVLAVLTGPGLVVAKLLWIARTLLRRTRVRLPELAREAVRMALRRVTRLRGGAGW